MKRIFSCSSSQVPAESWSRRDQKLLEAVERGDVSRVATLATSKRARPAKLNAAGQSAFHLAAAKGLPECLRLLLAHGAPIDERNLEGSTALHLATIACQPQCVKVLLQHGANEGHVDGQERTPLHWAASSGCASSVLLLCDHEAVLDVTDARGQTPLMLAAGGNHAAICAQLLRRGADPRLADKDNKTALALARECGSLESAELLLRYEGTLGGDKAPELRWHPGGTGNGPGHPPARGQGTEGGDNEEEEEDEELEVTARKEQEGHQVVADAVTLREPGQEGDKAEDDGGGKGDKDEDDGGGTRHPEELRKRKAVEEGEEGTQGHGEGDTVSLFLAWLGTECSELREVTSKARRWARGLRGELEGTLRNKLEGEVVAAATIRRSLVAWEKLVASLERALSQTHRSHGEILQRCQILLENSWSGTEPPGSKGLGGGGMETPHPNSLVGCGVETPKLNPLGMETPKLNSLVGGGVETPKLKPLVGGGMETPRPKSLVGGGLGTGGASRKLEEEVVELRENNGNLVEELGRLRGQRRRLREELGRLRGGAGGGGGGGEVGPGRSQVATVATIRTPPGRVAGPGGGDGDGDGEGVLGELQQKLEGLVRTQQRVLRLVTEMEGEEVATGTTGLAPGDGPEPPGPPNQPLEPLGDGPEPPGPPKQPLEPPGDGPEPPGPPKQPLEPPGDGPEPPGPPKQPLEPLGDGPEPPESPKQPLEPPEEVLKPPGPPEQPPEPPEPPLGWWQWQEVAVVAQERVAHLEQVLARLRERAGEREGTLKRLLGQTERLSAEVLGLRGQSAHLRLQIELQQKNHREIVAVYRSHLLSAAQGLMDPRVYAVLLQILRGPGGVAGEDPTPQPLCQ
ncbi:ankyrin repeat domain-containing protein 35 [Heliangelus exortis]|uniref:ankyrin repeat domain-containing protein 35 n=1 Tax=Heliangelus exortis TaxID=472823 RepID=UPI003A941120